MNIDIDKLEALALAATPGGFKLMTEEDYEKDDDLVEFGTPVGYVLASDGYELREYEDLDNAKLLEATNPSAILALIARLRESEKREQALAAHVERTSCLIHWIFDNVPLGRDACDKVLPFFGEQSRPDTSLARLKAKWQAEAFVSYAKRIAECNEPDDMECIEDIYDALMRQAAELRRQSQETTQ